MAENKEGFAAGPMLEFFPNCQMAPPDAKNPRTTRPPPIPEACTYDDLEPEMREIIRRGMAGKPRSVGSRIKGALDAALPNHRPAAALPPLPTPKPPGK